MAQNDSQWQIWPKKWLRLGQSGQNSQILSFCRFFYLFPQNEAKIDSEWSISPDSQLFPSFATKASHFWRNLKNCHFWRGGVHQPEPKCYIDLRFQLYHSWGGGGIYQPEPKCHVDLRFQLFHLWGGGRYISR